MPAQNIVYGNCTNLIKPGKAEFFCNPVYMYNIFLKRK